MTKLIALLGGGDWADASVEHLVVPADLDIEALKKEQRNWYIEEYLPDLYKWQADPKGRPQPFFRSLSDWLKERGATPATTDQIEEVWEIEEIE